MESSTYVFTEEFTGNVRSLRGVRAVAKLAHPKYGYFIGMTDGRTDEAAVFSLCSGARVIYRERPSTQTVDRIVWHRPGYPTPEIPPDAWPPDASDAGHFALSFEAWLPTSSYVDEATLVGSDDDGGWALDEGAAAWLVLWSAPRSELPDAAILVTEFDYDESEALVPA